MTKGIDPLTGSSADFRRMKGKHLLDRLEPARLWMEARKQSGHWQYTRALATAALPHAALLDVNGNRFEGVNFAVQDYLGLAAHPAIVQAAKDTADKYGVHSAGSGALVGNSVLSRQLENTIAEFLHCEHALLFPTGWAAGFGLINGLVRPGDYLVMDALAHACLQTGAAAATENVIRFRHNDAEDLRAKLKKIRSKDAEAAILVVIESLYSMDSDTPDIKLMQDIAHEYEATLMVDAAHDLGNLGPGGTGHIGAQGMLGKVDIVMGSFSKTFASNGGFVATNHPAVKEYLWWFSSPWTFSNALSPIQCAVVLKAFEIIRANEGEKLRQSLINNVCGLRNGLEKYGIEVLGDPSAIVPVVVGDQAMIRTASRLLPEYNVLANTAEYPVVDLTRSRFRMQVMATHTEEDVKKGAEGVARAIEQAKELMGVHEQATE
jgi:7-keto-8-aminopelargonate synthetase-like enzyme